MKPPHLRLFVLHMTGTQSMGPQPLYSLWSAACGSDEVSVARSTPTLHARDAATYLLATHTHSIHDDAEDKIRASLAALGYTFRLSRTN